MNEWLRASKVGPLALTAMRARVLTGGMTESLTVNLGPRSYPIHFGRDAAERLVADVAELRAAGRPFAWVSDENVAKACGNWLAEVFGNAPSILTPAGEAAKSLDQLGRVLEFLAAQRIDRTGAVFAVGGGVVGDLAGFAAAAYLRGVALHQVPTTLLAMVDSSVGGKTGINLSAGKNLVGAFHQPRAVYVDPRVLATLSSREFAAGMAEVIKYGLLGDAELFDQLEATALRPGSEALAEVVRRCCVAKARVVEADEHELAKEGGRALLNLGHTFGHAIEKVAGYGGYLHGEAVAIGLVAAARLSVELGLLGEDVPARIERVLEAHQLPTRLQVPLPLSQLQAATLRDKKVRAGRLRYVVLQRIGEAITRADVEEALVERVWRTVGAR